MRAVAAFRRGIVDGAPPRLLIVGAGPERERLRRHADELPGIGDSSSSFETLPYSRMPEVFASATVLVLASLATAMWEEQFGMVVAEAFAAGVPVAGSDSGALPEVVRAEGSVFPAGDWRALAVLLAGQLVEPGPEIVAEYSIEAAADRLDRAYRRVLAA